MYPSLELALSDLALGSKTALLIASPSSSSIQPSGNCNTRNTSTSFGKRRILETAPPISARIKLTGGVLLVHKHGLKMTSEQSTEQKLEKWLVRHFEKAVRGAIPSLKPPEPSNQTHYNDRKIQASLNADSHKPFPIVEKLEVNKLLNKYWVSATLSLTVWRYFSWESTPDIVPELTLASHILVYLIVVYPKAIRSANGARNMALTMSHSQTIATAQ